MHPSFHPISRYLLFFLAAPVFAQGPNPIPMNTPIDLLKARGWVLYSDFGAAGDGETDDLPAIAAAHAFANREGLPVKADAGATYHIGGRNISAVIQTDTDFGDARFLIDDTAVENRGAPVFSARSLQEPFRPEGITSLRRDQEHLGVALPGPCLVTVTNAAKKQYIRFGPNQNSGTPQRDIFLVDAQGRVDPNTPVLWDFDAISEIRALPLDADTMTIRGGHFTTLANRAESKYTYYKRGIEIARSNVRVEGIEHHIRGEGDHGAPYDGFLHIRDCANVTVEGCLFTARKTYQTIGSAGRTVSMGSYGITVNRSLNVSFIDCAQTTDLDDRRYWGIMASNFSKNLLYDRCRLSRFDAHMGVANATIRNSVIGHAGIQLIGSGLFLVENTTVRGASFVNLRDDYGSTWHGDFVIRDCVFIPRSGNVNGAVLIGASNPGQHDFGYPCTMPERIVIENLRIEDGKPPEGYKGVAVFADVRRNRPQDAEGEPFPYALTRELLLRNVSTASGVPLRISQNPALFQDIRILQK